MNNVDLIFNVTYVVDWFTTHVFHHLSRMFLHIRGCENEN